eukprot:scaffold398654_cov45-Prasinocladus_malaysianus.AAC.1
MGVAKAAFIGGILTITDTTDSTYSGTGSLLTYGGLGVAKDTSLGGTLDVEAETQSTSTDT